MWSACGLLRNKRYINKELLLLLLLLAVYNKNYHLIQVVLWYHAWKLSTCDRSETFMFSSKLMLFLTEVQKMYKNDLHSH